MTPIREAKESESVTASHELLEMLIDPGAQLWAQASNGVQYAYEVCDAVEDETYIIKVGDIDVSVSDFVYPSFYESWHAPNSDLDGKARTRFDYLNKISRPFQTLRRGYQIVSIRGAIAEEFGSPRKQAAFLNEDRTMHRSEYRIATAAGAASGDNPFCPGGYIPGRSFRAADNPFCPGGYIPGRSAAS